MGLVYANIKIQNGDDIALSRRQKIGEDEIREMTIKMMVDTGSVSMAINEETRLALGLDIVGHRPSVLADGTRIKLPVTSSIVVWFEDRSCQTEAVVLPGYSEPLFGAIPMEALDLWVNPANNVLTGVHPEGPVWSLRSVFRPSFFKKKKRDSAT